MGKKKEPRVALCWALLMIFRGHWSVSTLWPERSSTMKRGPYALSCWSEWPRIYWRGAWSGSGGMKCSHCIAFFLAESFFHSEIKKIIIVFWFRCAQQWVDKCAINFCVSWFIRVYDFVCHLTSSPIDCSRPPLRKYVMTHLSFMLDWMLVFGTRFARC